MWEKTQVEIPESAKASLRILLAQRQQAETLIGTYIQALRDSLNVEGDGWTIELNNMIFIKQTSPNGKVTADVVGAIASDNPGK